MWTPKFTESQNISQKDFEKILSGQIPALVVRNFYSETQCMEIIKKIETSKKNIFSKIKT